MFKTLFLLVTSLFFSPASAQSNKVGYAQIISLQKTSSFYNLNFRTEKPKQINGLSGINKGIHYTALFCRMENKMHKQLNIWVKLRAGNDDDYRKLCGQR